MQKATWTQAARLLNTKGYFIEGQALLLSKTVTRPGKRSIKVYLRKAGYAGKGIEYREHNVGGINGYIFYCKDKVSNDQAHQILSEALRKDLEL